jgi:hypothetical protein
MVALLVGLGGILEMRTVPVVLVESSDDMVLWLCGVLVGEFLRGVLLTDEIFCGERFVGELREFLLGERLVPSRSRCSVLRRISRRSVSVTEARTRALEGARTGLV